MPAGRLPFIRSSASRTSRAMFMVFPSGWRRTFTSTASSPPAVTARARKLSPNSTTATKLLPLVP